MANRKKKQPLYRTQILLEPEQHAALARLAEATDRSISQVVREAVVRYLTSEDVDDTEVQERLAVLEEIARHREEMLAERDGMPIETSAADQLEEIRARRDEELLGGFDNRS